MSSLRTQSLMQEFLSFAPLICRIDGGRMVKLKRVSRSD